MLTSSKGAVKKILLPSLLEQLPSKRRIPATIYLILINLKHFASFVEVRILGYYFDPKKLSHVTIKKAVGWSSIKTTLCLFFNMGDKVATPRIQKTEEADKIEPYRLDRTQSGGGVIIY